MKVLFRFGLALLPLENKLAYLDAKEGDNRIGDLINQMKDECTRCHDVELLRKIAFRQLTIPGRRELRVKRSIYLQKIQESLIAAKDKEKLYEKLNSCSEEEIDLSSEQLNDENRSNDNNVFRKGSSFKRSNSANIQQQQSPSNRLNWFRKRLSLVNFYPLSMQRQAVEAAQKNAFKGLNGVRSCEAVSRNGEKLVQMIASVDHYHSRVHLQLRDTHYSHIFYPNRRNSIVLSDREQHHNAILTLKNLYNKNLFIAGVSDDGRWIVLLDQDQGNRKFHCGWLNDSNVNVLILRVPFSVLSWYFDELSWQVICLDKENKLWRCDLADPSKSSLCTDFLKKQLSNEPKLNYLNMLAYDDKYCLLWVHMVTKITAKDQTEEALKRNSVSERMTLSLDLSSDDELTLQNDDHLEDELNNNDEDHHLVDKLSKSENNSEHFKGSIEDLDDDEEDLEQNYDVDQNDLCSCSTTESTGNMCDHFNDHELFRNEFLENNKCVKNCTEKCVSKIQQFNEPIANRLLSRRVTMSTIFRKNSLIILDSSPSDHSILTDYLINKHGHANLSSTAKDQLKQQKEFQCTVRFALENRIRMHKLFESKQNSTGQKANNLQTQHSQQSNQSSNQKKPRKHVYHQDNHKNDDLAKIETNDQENMTKQLLFVFDTCSMELFGILKLDASDGQLVKIYCLGGVAYCGFSDGSIVAFKVILSGNNDEQLTNRRQLLQPQPDDELIDLRVFNANSSVRMDTIIQQTLAEQLRSESMSSKESINSAVNKSKNNSTSIDEEDDDDEELIHFDAILMNNSRKNSINRQTSPVSNLVNSSMNNSILNSISNLSSSISHSVLTQSVSSSKSNSINSSMNNSISDSHSNSVFNSINSSKENLKKTSSNSSSEFSFDSKKRVESSSQDGMSSTTITGADLSSPTAKCPRIERNLPSLATIFNNSANGAFLVLALYKSGKLHCIYLKNGCVQERKLFRIDGQLKSELPLNSLRIVNAFKMNWSDETTEDEQTLNNINDLISNDELSKSNESNKYQKVLNKDQTESNENRIELNKKDNHSDLKMNSTTKLNSDDLNKRMNDKLTDQTVECLNGDKIKSNKMNGHQFESNNNEMNENNRNLPEQINSNRTELNGTINQGNSKDELIQTSNRSNLNNSKEERDQFNEEFENSKSKLSKRSSINANQCNYLVTLWSPHPINRLVNVKL